MAAALVNRQVAKQFVEVALAAVHETWQPETPHVSNTMQCKCLPSPPLHGSAVGCSLLPGRPKERPAHCLELPSVLAGAC